MWALCRAPILCLAPCADYWTLTKTEITFLIALTTAAAFCIGSPAPSSRFPWTQLLHAILGTVLVASGAGALNQLIEWPFDTQMRRTARRPIAASRIAADPCSDFRSPVVACGRPLPGSGSTPRRGYLFLYTPLKRLNPMCTLAAAISRCRAGADRLRRRGRKAHHAGLLSLRDTLPVAIPAFPGYCLDVS